MKVVSSIAVFIAFMLLSLTQIDAFEVCGTIQDRDGSPLIGANVINKSTNQGSITDIDGHFCMKDVEKGQKLIISYTGYMTQEITIKDNKEINILLEESQLLMEEVVVTGNSRTNYPPPPPMVYEEVLNSISAGYSGSPNGHKVENQRYQENTEEYGKIQENGFRSSKDEPLSTFSIDVDRAAYSNVRRFINQGSLPPKDAVRIEEMINYFHYDYAEPSGKHPIHIATTLRSCPWNNEHQLLHIALKGKEIKSENLPPSNLVFLIDVSGSMDAPNKLGLVKSSFKLLVNQLRAEDRVAIVVYAGAAGLVLESTPGSNKTQILDALEKLQAGGSTAGGAGIKLAYKIAVENFAKDGNNRVILATDGDFNVGASSNEAMIDLIEDKRESGVFLSVLGYGMGNYKDHKMQEIADKGNGNHAYIDNIQEAQKVLVSEFGGTLFTIAKDVKIQVEFNPSHVKSYRLVGYENRMLHKEDFNDDKKDAGEVGAGHTMTAIYEIIPANSNSRFAFSVDELKYQKKNNHSTEEKKASKEMCTVKLRYKHPDSDKSIKLDLPVQADKIDDNGSSDVNFATAVANFGLLLRKSDYVQTGTYKDVIQQAQKSLGKDYDGYRSEFIRLVQSVEQLDQNWTVQEK